MSSRSVSRERHRPRTRSLTPRSDYSDRDHRRRDSLDSRHSRHSITPSRSPTPTPRRNGGRRSYSRSPSRRSDSRGRSPTPRPSRGTKIVVERLTKNVNEDHLYEIFGQFGPIKDLDLPINRFGVNRGTAYLLYDHEADAEEAIAHMHEGQIDGAMINVSIVLPRRKMSPPPPMARRGAGIDPRVPHHHPRGPGRMGGPRGRGGWPVGPPRRYGPRSDTYRPRSLSRSLSPSRSFSRSRSRSRSRARSRSRSPPRAPRSRGGGSRYRSRSRSYSPSRSRTPPGRRGRGSRGHRYRSPSRSSHDSYDDRSRDASRGRRRHY
ncbi:hypothetical protein ACRALDRAFT_1075915 [Sodiomyces alcalophilus JCM 7366]|uniref:uncharacterized protein n=1 Tax=Sodiomyces alcalophilus JCM 7366 TaxID=591952 RepID=UPI0039B474B0